MFRMKKTTELQQSPISCDLRIVTQSLHIVKRVFLMKNFFSLIFSKFPKKTIENFE